MVSSNISDHFSFKNDLEKKSNNRWLTVLAGCQKKYKRVNYLTILQNVKILLLSDYPHKISDKEEL